MKVLAHFCICVEHDSLNVSGSEKCFEQDLHKKNTHTIFTLYIFPNTAILYVGKNSIVNILACYTMCKILTFSFTFSK